MSLCRRSLFIAFSFLAIFTFAAVASAQECDQCDPYTSHCSDECDRCTHQGIDGCTAWATTTCGSAWGLGDACLADDCWPSWSETSRVTQGTYDGRSFSSCDHHSLQWVTLTDAHQCNGVSDYWTQSYCDNVIDGHRYYSGYYPSCCDGVDDYGPNSLFTCNGYHSCTG